MDFYDLFQNFRISEATRQAGDAKSQTRVHEITLRSLQDQIDHLSMVCMAMGELLEEVGFNKEMLISKIEEIDLRDGKKDGKYIPSLVCSSCNRKIAPRHVSCIYCGTTVKREGVV